MVPMPVVAIILIPSVITTSLSEGTTEEDEILGVLESQENKTKAILNKKIALTIFIFFPLSWS
jgi:hypothetical protein